MLSTICGLSGASLAWFKALDALPRPGECPAPELQVDRGPFGENSSGRSRKGAQIRAIRKMSSRTGRWSAGLRPFGCRTARMKPSKKAHSSSDIGLRAKLTFRLEMILKHSRLCRRTFLSKQTNRFQTQSSHEQ